MNINVLDNPVWNALEEVHCNKAVDYGYMKCYHPDFCPFGGYTDGAQTSSFIDQYSETVDNFFIVGKKPTFSNNVRFVNELICNQMVLDKRIEMDADENILQISDSNSIEVYKLVTEVLPGYFREKTIELGSYFAKKQDGKIVALAGERMKMIGYTEISAIVTHPNYVGNGYASKLIHHVTGKIFEEDKIPFLHVSETNTLAIHLYEKLGFKTRRKMSFWNFAKNV